MANNTLGNELQQLSHLLEALIVKETNPSNRKVLRDRLSQVLDAIQELVELNVAKATNEYNLALANVQRANSDILLAIQDLSKVATTINQLAQVVDVLGKLAVAAA